MDPRLTLLPQEIETRDLSSLGQTAYGLCKPFQRTLLIFENGHPFLLGHRRNESLSKAEGLIEELLGPEAARSVEDAPKIANRIKRLGAGG